MNRSVIGLDSSRLLGFDQAPGSNGALPGAGGTVTKRFGPMAAKVGDKGGGPINK